MWGIRAKKKQKLQADYRRSELFIWATLDKLIFYLKVNSDFITIKAMNTIKGYN